MSKQKKFISILSLILVFLLSGCVNNVSKSQSDKNNVGSKKAAQYPIKVEDSYGRKISIKSEPKRIVSGAPDITETIFALGQGKKLVGRTDFCKYPKEVKNIPSIGGLQTPNIEKIVDLKPDVVITSSFFPKESIKKLEDMGITVVSLYNAESFDGVYKTINTVGQIINANDKAYEVVNGMKKKVSDVEKKVKGKKRPSVYYVLYYGKAGDYTAGKDTFVGKMIEMAGGKNAADDVSGWSYSVEKLVDKNPDILICSKYFNAKLGIQSTNGYKDLTAVKNGKLFEIDNDLIDIQGPRLADGLEAIAHIIHPELFK